MYPEPLAAILSSSDSLISFLQFFEKLLGFHRALAGELRTMQLGFNSRQIEQRRGAVRVTPAY